MSCRAAFVLCTYNPDPERLRRTVESLAAQNLKIPLVVVDNRSAPPVAEAVVSRPGLATRLVVEEEPGLTPARLRGALEADAEVLIYVDDDNVLSPDYVETAISYLDARPDIGVFSANISGEFGCGRQDWMKPFLPFLALTRIKEDRWSFKADGGTMPVGAGMVVRREVMNEYRRQLETDPMRRALDRDGRRLLAGGDTDIGYACLSLGMGCGWCRDLRLTHLIPSGRLEAGYLHRLVKDVSASHEFLLRLHTRSGPGVVRELKWMVFSCLGRVFGLRSRWGFRSSRLGGRLAGLRMYRDAVRKAQGRRFQ